MPQHDPELERAAAAFRNRYGAASPLRPPEDREEPATAPEGDDESLRAAAEVYRSRYGQQGLTTAQREAIRAAEARPKVRAQRPARPPSLTSRAAQAADVLIGTAAANLIPVGRLREQLETDVIEGAEPSVLAIPGMPTALGLAGATGRAAGELAVLETLGPLATRVGRPVGRLANRFLGRLAGAVPSRAVVPEALTGATRAGPGRLARAAVQGVTEGTVSATTFGLMREAIERGEVDAETIQEAIQYAPYGAALGGVLGAVGASRLGRRRVAGRRPAAGEAAEDPFVTLGLDPKKATAADVRRAWRNKMWIWRPDINPAAEAAGEMARYTAARNAALDRLGVRPAGRPRQPAPEAPPRRPEPAPTPTGAPAPRPAAAPPPLRPVERGPERRQAAVPVGVERRIRDRRLAQAVTEAEAEIQAMDEAVERIQRTAAEQQAAVRRVSGPEGLPEPTALPEKPVISHKTPQDATEAMRFLKSLVGRTGRPLTDYEGRTLRFGDAEYRMSGGQLTREAETVPPEAMTEAETGQAAEIPTGAPLSAGTVPAVGAIPSYTPPDRAGSTDRPGRAPSGGTESTFARPEYRPAEELGQPKRAPPERTARLTLGMHGARTVEFADAFEKDFFSAVGRSRRQAAGQPTIKPDWERMRVTLSERLGRDVSPLEVGKIALAYRKRVLSEARAAEAGDVIRAPAIAEVLRGPGEEGPAQFTKEEWFKLPLETHIEHVVRAHDQSVTRGTTLGRLDPAKATLLKRFLRDPTDPDALESARNTEISNRTYNRLVKAGIITAPTAAEQEVRSRTPVPRTSPPSALQGIDLTLESPESLGRLADLAERAGAVEDAKALRAEIGRREQGRKLSPDYEAFQEPKAPSPGVQKVQQIQQAFRAKMDAIRAQIPSDLPEAIEFQPEPDLVRVLSRDIQEPGKYRITDVRPYGLLGHTVHSTLDDAVKELATGRREAPRVVSGVVDEWAKRPGFLTGPKRQKPPAQEAGPEKIRAAVVYDIKNDEWVEAPTHAMAEAEIEDRGGVVRRETKSDLDWFMTTLGRRVHREEAGRLARAAQQWPEEKKFTRELFGKKGPAAEDLYFAGQMEQKPPPKLETKVDEEGVAEPPPDVQPAAFQSGKAAAQRIVQMESGDIRMDPERFQFKELGTEGVSRELKEVQVWNPKLAGVISVWRDPADGQVYVVNGHHRLELANRTGGQTLNVQFLDVPDAKAARAEGAFINMGEGRGTPSDVAKFLRDGPFSMEDVKARGISLRGDLARKGIALSRLADDVFQAVARGDIPERWGVAIGEMLEEPALQRDALRAIRNTKLSEAEVREVARQIQAAGVEEVAQETLFGTEVERHGLYVQKAQVAAALKRRLAADRRLFGFVAKEGRAEELARAGTTQIDVEAAKELAGTSATAEEVFDRLYTRSGPVASIVQDAARRLAHGESVRTVVADVYPQIGEAVLSERVGRGDLGAAGAAPGRVVPPGPGEPSRDRLGETGEVRPEAGGEGQPEVELQDPNQRALFERARTPYTVVSPITRLRVVHNLSPENLVAADKLGGLPAPSMAVVPEEVPGPDQYGSITLIGRPNLGDPSQVDIYDADAYSARNPLPEYRPVPFSKLKALDAELRPVAEEFDDDVRPAVINALGEGSVREALRAMENSPAVMALYLRERGKNVQASKRRRQVTVPGAARPAMRAFVKEHGVPQGFDYGDSYHRALSDAMREAVTQWADEVAAAEGEPGVAAGLARAVMENWFGDDGLFAFGRWHRLRNDLILGDKLEPDQFKNRERFRKMLRSDEGFVDWVRGKIEPLLGKPYLRVGGRRVPFTAENVVAGTKRGAAQEAGMTFGPGAARAAGARRFYDTEQMRREAAEPTGVRPKAEVEAARDATKEAQESWRTAMLEYLPDPARGVGATWDALDNMHKALGAAMRDRLRRGMKAGLRHHLSRMGFRGVPDELIDQGVDLARRLEETPVPYFEAKPHRVVSFNEIAGALIPERAPVSVRQILERRGIPFRTYKTPAQRAQLLTEMAREANAVFEPRATYGPAPTSVRETVEQGDIFGAPSRRMAERETIEQRDLFAMEAGQRKIQTAEEIQRVRREGREPEGERPLDLLAEGEAERFRPGPMPQPALPEPFASGQAKRLHERWVGRIRQALGAGRELTLPQLWERISRAPEMRRGDRMARADRYESLRKALQRMRSEGLVTGRWDETGMPRYRLGVAPVRGAIREVGPEYQPSEKDQFSAPEEMSRLALEHYGETKDYREVGYITPDGKMLDFSGRHEGNDRTGDRFVDHRDVASVIAGEQALEANAGMRLFMAAGNVRVNGFSDDRVLLDMARPLTPAQRSVIRKGIAEIIRTSRHPLPLWAEVTDREGYTIISESADVSSVAAAFRLIDGVQARAFGTGSAAREVGPVYHGSPYTFEQFDIEKVGTGEGAMAYGYGIYMADLKQTAAFYKQTGTVPGAPTGRAKWQIKNVAFPTGRAGHAALDTAQEIEMLLYWKKHGKTEDVKYITGQIERRIARFRASDAEGYQSGSSGDDMRALADFYDQHVKNVKSTDIVERSGVLYEVMLDVDPETLLDWDAPLRDQPTKVKEALKNLGRDVDAPSRFTDKQLYARAKNYFEGDRWRQDAAEDIGMRERVSEGYRAFSEGPAAFRRWANRQSPNSWVLRRMIGPQAVAELGTGEHLYNTIGANYEEASRILLEVGIKGIRYLDQGSRTKPMAIRRAEEMLAESEPGSDEYREAKELLDDLTADPLTYNYVIFDDKAIKITGVNESHAKRVFGSAKAAIEAAQLALFANRVSTLDERLEVVNSAPQTWVDIRGKRIASARDAATVLRPFRSPKAEHFPWILTDDTDTVLGVVTYTSGAVDTIAFADQLPRIYADLVRRAERLGATKVILAHNHPSGNVTPSQDDIAFTNEIVRYFRLGAQGPEGQVLKGRLRLAKHYVIDHNTIAEIVVPEDVWTTPQPPYVPYEVVEHKVPAAAEGVDWTVSERYRIASPGDAMKLVGIQAPNRGDVIYMDRHNRAMAVVPHQLGAFDHMETWLDAEAKSIGASSAIIVLDRDNPDAFISVVRSLRKKDWAGVTDLLDVIGTAPQEARWVSAQAIGYWAPTLNVWGQRVHRPPAPMARQLRERGPGYEPGREGAEPVPGAPAGAAGGPAAPEVVPSQQAYRDAVAAIRRRQTGGAALPETPIRSLRKAEGAEIRNRLGLDVLAPPARQRFQDAWDEARERNMATDAVAISMDAAANHRPLTPVEHAAAVQKYLELERDLLATRRTLEEATLAGNDAAVRVAAAKSTTIVEQIGRLTEATDRTGTEAGRALSIRRLRANIETFDLAHGLQLARARKGASLTPDEIRRIEQLTEQVKALEARNTVLRAENEKLATERDKTIAERVAKIETQRVRAERQKVAKVERIRTDRQAILKQLTDLGVRLNDISGVSAEGIYLIGRLAVNHIQEQVASARGKVTLDGIVEAVLEDLNNPEIIASDIYRALTAKDPNRQTQARSEANRQVGELTSQARLLAKIEDAERGVFDATKPPAARSAEVRTLQRRLRDLRNSAYRSGMLPDRLERALATINSLQDQLANHYRLIKQRREPEGQELTELKQRIRGLRREMAVQDQLADLREQLRTGDFKLPAERRAGYTSPALERNLVALRQARRAWREAIERMEPMTARRVIRETTGTLRALKATADMSATLRQAFWAGMRRPQATARAFGGAFKAFFSTYTADQIQEAIHQHPNQLVRDQAGLHLSAPGGALTDREEYFSSTVAERIPVIGAVVRASERHMVTMLNLLRVSAFDDFVARYPNATLDELQRWADWINVATGRGDLGRAGAVAGELSTVFFAPRFAISRIQTPTRLLKHWREPRVRKEIAKDYAGVLSLVLTTLGLASLAGADVGLDPRDPDFGKIRIGNTRIDLWAGVQQPFRLLARLMLGATDRLGLTGQDLTAAQKEVDPLELLGRFAAFKASPIITVPTEFYRGKTAVGERVTPVETAVRALLPLVWEDTYEAWRQGGAKVAAGTAALAFFGAGAQTYGDPQRVVRRRIREALEAGRRDEARRLADEWNAAHPDTPIRGVERTDGQRMNLYPAPRRTGVRSPRTPARVR